jgi:hypothetical protein
LIDMLQAHGDDRFKNSEFVMKSLVGYVNGFIIWVRQMSGMSSNASVVNEQAQPVGQTQEEALDFDAKCPLCGTVYGFTNEADFMMSNKVCEANGTCIGILEPVKG